MMFMRQREAVLAALPINGAAAPHEPALGQAKCLES